MIKSLLWKWKKFWGKRYWIYKDEKEVGEILFYGHKIYITKLDWRNNNE